MDFPGISTSYKLSSLLTRVFHHSALVGHVHHQTQMLALVLQQPFSTIGCDQVVLTQRLTALQKATKKKGPRHSILLSLVISSGDAFNSMTSSWFELGGLGGGT